MYFPNRFFSAVIHLNMTFKYISGRVTIILRNKKKIMSGGCPSQKKIDF
jgi:hypothetical protein